MIPPVFTSLGLFIIDEIHFNDGTSIHDILGGGGTFAIVGSRMILGSSRSTESSWIVDIGNDCPSEILQELKNWNTGAIFRYHKDRPCNHGWNKYGEREYREFKFTTPSMDITVNDLLNYQQLLYSKSFHFILCPEDCQAVLTKLADIHQRPYIVWEPDPGDCRNGMLEKCIPVLPQIDILSPNAAEAASFLNLTEPKTESECEDIALKFLPYMSKTSKSAIVLRCGEMGSLLYSHKGKKWFAPYHIDQSKVVDPTGCGNTFVGGLSTALALTDGNLIMACICGTLASGASIEQHGPPRLGDADTWNGTTMQKRAEIYLNTHPEFGITAVDFTKKLLQG